MSMISSFSYDLNASVYNNLVTFGCFEKKTNNLNDDDILYSLAFVSSGGDQIKIYSPHLHTDFSELQSLNFKKEIIALDCGSFSLDNNENEERDYLLIAHPDSITVFDIIDDITIFATIIF